GRAPPRVAAKRKTAHPQAAYHIPPRRRKHHFLNRDSTAFQSPTTALTSIDLRSRQIVSLIGSPGGRALMELMNVFSLRTGLPFSSRIASLRLTPADSAGVFGWTPSTSAP